MRRGARGLPLASSCAPATRVLIYLTGTPKYVRAPFVIISFSLHAGAAVFALHTSGPPEPWNAAVLGDAFDRPAPCCHRLAACDGLGLALTERGEGERGALGYGDVFSCGGGGAELRALASGDLLASCAALRSAVAAARAR